MGTDKESEEMKQLREVVFNDNLKMESMAFSFTDGEEITIDHPWILEGIRNAMRKKLEDDKAR